ncbi:MAG: hypothetical protein HXX11_16610 [Desulfuromonadales bacterium]|nr:hypothetical protein [Desulfuromonadales bacterium]
MKLRFQPTVFFTTVLLGALTCLSGCATTGMDRATKTTNLMQTVEGDYRETSGQIDITRASLEDLIKPTQTEVKKANDVYTDNVVKMEKLGKRLDTHTDNMRTKGNDYFMGWESSYTNPDIRELSERRRIEMREIYAKIPEASIGVKGALKSYLTDIREIQKYLANDLTPLGIAAINPIAQRALTDGENVKEAIKPVLSAIDQVKFEMTRGGAVKTSETDQK